MNKRKRKITYSLSPYFLKHIWHNEKELLLSERMENTVIGKGLESLII